MTSQPATPLGQRLRELREGAGLKGYQLAAQLKTGQNRVSDWRRMIRRPLAGSTT